MEPDRRRGATVELRPWREDDLPLLHQANTAEMTAHLGGVEPVAVVEDRHRRYLEHVRLGTARVRAITEGAGPAVGAIVSSRRRWSDREILEVGWFVVPGSQGRGIASQSLGLLIEDARRRPEGAERLMAFPAVSNLAPNALCRRLGMRMDGSPSFPFRGREFVVNAWALDLTP